jgi:2-keto-3-deoxy-L-rhamnonate aldolase RhmA
MLGAFLCSADPTIAEVMAQADFDLLVIDAEHSAFGPAEVQVLVRALEPSRAAGIVRVPELLQSHVQWALDSGARGILFPQISSGAETLRAVSFCRYPPAGRRGLGPGRATGWGSYIAAYQERANDDLAVLIQIENQAALDNLEEIVATPGVDLIFMGPGDLSQGLGVSGQLSHPRVVEAMNRIVEVCRSHDMPIGTLALTEDSARRWTEAGASLLLIGSDTMFLQRSSQDVANRFRPIIHSKE